MGVNKLTKIVLAFELFEQGNSKTDIAIKLQLNRETVHLWIKSILEMGLLEFLDHYTSAKNGLNFLNYSFEKRYKHTNLLQDDGGHEWKDEFKQNVLKFADRFRVARPYNKNEQSFITYWNRQKIAP